MNAPSSLVRYDAACRAVAECKAVDEVKDWRDKAAALQAYARQAKNKQLEVDAAEIRIRAERRLGQMLEQSAESGERQTRGGDAQAKSSLPTLADMGISKDLSARAQQIASIPEEEFEQTLAEHRAEQQAVTGRTMERLATRAHVANNSGENEWYTPALFIEAARKSMGGIDLDPASCELANATVKAATYYDIAANGLVQPWRGRVWMNPPYAQPLIQQFTDRLVAVYEAGEIEQAVVLVNNGTETAWGQALLNHASAACFPRSRVRFIDKAGNPSGAPLQGQMVLYFGSRAREFSEAFFSLGVILRG